MKSKLLAPILLEGGAEAPVHAVSDYDFESAPRGQ